MENRRNIDIARLNNILAVLKENTPKEIVEKLEEIQRKSGFGTYSFLNFIYFLGISLSIHKNYHPIKMKRELDEIADSNSPELVEKYKNFSEYAEGFKYLELSENKLRKYKYQKSDYLIVAPVSISKIRQSGMSSMTKQSRYQKIMKACGFELFNENWAQYNFTQAWIIDFKRYSFFKMLPNYFDIFIVNNPKVLRGKNTKMRNLSFNELREYAKELENEKIISKTKRNNYYVQYSNRLTDIAGKDEFVKKLGNTAHAKRRAEILKSLFEDGKDEISIFSQKLSRHTTRVSTMSKRERRIIFGENYLDVDINSSSFSLLFIFLKNVISLKNIENYVKNKKKIRKFVANRIFESFLYKNLDISEGEALKVAKAMFNLLPGQTQLKDGQYRYGISKTFVKENLKRALIDNVFSDLKTHKIFDKKLLDVIYKMLINTDKISLEKAIQKLKVKRNEALSKQLNVFKEKFLKIEEGYIEKFKKILQNIFYNCEYIRDIINDLQRADYYIRKNPIVVYGFNPIISLTHLIHSLETKIVNDILIELINRGMRVAYVYDGFLIHKEDFKEIGIKGIEELSRKSIEDLGCEGNLSFSVEEL